MMHALQSVILFEARRSLTRGRMLIWIGLAIFPSLLMTLLQIQANGRAPEEPLALAAFYLVPQISCMLGLLLWATPAVGAELESQTWIYIATRPRGRIALVLGKYVVAVVWSVSACLPSAIGVAAIGGFDALPQMIGTLCVLVLLSSLCYGALYVLLGIVVSRRATVIAVVYSLIIEGAVSSIPATVNKLTVCYRLRALLVEWGGVERLRFSADNFFGHEPAWQHVMSLLVYAVLLLGLSVWIIRTKEFGIQSES